MSGEHRDVAAFLLDAESAGLTLAPKSRMTPSGPDLHVGSGYTSPSRDSSRRCPSAIVASSTRSSMSRCQRSNARSVRTPTPVGRSLARTLPTRGSRAHALTTVGAAPRSRAVLQSIEHGVLLPMLRPRTPPAWWTLIDRIVGAPAYLKPTIFYFPWDDLFVPSARTHGIL